MRSEFQNRFPKLSYFLEEQAPVILIRGFLASVAIGAVFGCGYIYARDKTEHRTKQELVIQLDMERYYAQERARRGFYSAADQKATLEDAAAVTLTLEILQRNGYLSEADVDSTLKKLNPE